MFDPDQVYRISRNVSIRPVGDAFVVESLTSGRTMPLSSPSVFRLLLAVARPVRGRDLLAGVNEAQRPAVLRFLERCQRDGVLTVVGADGEETGEGLSHWEFHDLFFHVRSRRGRNPGPMGATYPLRGRVPPEPAFREDRVPETVPLQRPDMARLAEADASFTSVLEGRRSRHCARPVPLERLGEFLFRACRVTEVQHLEDGETLARRVYPSGGSLHSLETYVTAWACDGLARGVYRYRPCEHDLVPLRGWDAEVEGLLRDAQAATGRPGDFPPVLLTLASRFRRVSYKYQSLAYRLVLQEVGALYQTMYLIATAMGLAPCALGGGDSDRFARVTGVDYYHETSVGEFILGGGDEAAASEPGG